MSRIPYFDMSQASAEVLAAVSTRRPLNIYRMLPHAGPAAIGFLALGSALLTKNELDTPLRELVIVRVGILCGSSYEVHQHKRLAAHVGVTAAKIEALHDGPDAAAFDDFERTVLRFTDEVVLNVKSGNTLFAAVAAKLSHRALVELVLTIGFYMMVSRFLENFEVDIEEVAPPL